MRSLWRFSLSALVVLTLLKCSGDKPKAEPQSGEKSLGGTQGLMNFRQMKAAWAAATGLDPYSLPLEKAFDELKDRLPATNSADQLTQPVVTASIAFGSAYCHALVDREAKMEASERRFFGQLALDKAPEDAALRDAASKLTNALWRRTMSEEEAAELVALGKDIYQIGLAKPSATRASAGRESWLSLCSATGAALDALTL